MLAVRNRSDPAPLFATGFWLRIGADGRGRYASSGHPAMLLRRGDGAIESLPSTGPPLGLLPAGEFDDAGLRLEPGDTLFLFSDGVSETTDAQGEELGQQRLAGILASARGAPLAKARAIYGALADHRPTSLLEDDLTFMIAEPV